MDSEQSTVSGLVALYADRLRSRALMSPTEPLALPAAGVRSFGRTTPRRRRKPVRRTATVSALVATGLIVGTQAASAATVHQVQPGETLAGIAGEYHVSIQQLTQLNGIANPDKILAGSTLTISADAPSPPTTSDTTSDNTANNGTTTSPTTTTGTTYHVVAGDTLSKIANQYGVTVEAVAQLNGIGNPDRIVVGTNLAIPAIGASATQRATLPEGAAGVGLHLVVPGETLTTIAKQYGVTVSALGAANDISNLDLVKAGQLLRIPAGTKTTAVQTPDGATKLLGMPVAEQSLPLSCEAAAVSIATAYWGDQVSEWVFIENMPSNANPHLGFRGKITGAFGGTTNYGVYAEPFVSILSRYGYTGDVFYGGASDLKAQIDQGHPVVAWVTNMASVQTKSYGTADGARFALVPQEHAVVVYGYDDKGVYVADPGDGTYRQFNWADFLRSWGYFDGMSLAVYPSS